MNLNLQVVRLFFNGFTKKDKSKDSEKNTQLKITKLIKHDLKDFLSFFQENKRIYILFIIKNTCLLTLSIGGASLEI